LEEKLGMLFRSHNASGVFFSLLILLPITLSAQTFTTIVNFDSSNASPGGALVKGADGNFYGIAENGGARGRGAVFLLNTAGTVTGLTNFYGKNGKTPTGLILADDGNFYGTTYYGGLNGGGTIFKMDPQGYLTSLYSFEGVAYPTGPLTQGADGNFYGTTVNGGGISAPGTAFKITPDGALATIYTFCSRSNCIDGRMPFGPLTQGPDGSFFGTTDSGGARQFYGTIFTLTPSGNLTTLHNFCSQPKCADGYQGNGLLLASDGNFYGTTSLGGSYTSRPCQRNGCGTLFKIAPDGTFTVLHTFCTEAGCPDGNQPGRLIQGTDGNLYGTTSLGGTNSSCPNSANGCGTVYQVTPSGQLTTLHSFDGSDGMYAGIELLQDTDGSFYGMTGAGGEFGYGTVFWFSMGLSPFVHMVRSFGEIGQTGAMLGQGLEGANAVLVNGIPANFTVVSDTLIEATIPVGATSGYVNILTPGGTLPSDTILHVR
jgi:uncharacterized repeat protein (TIGR03803 family)